jgi:hypothetical protein
MYWRCYLEHHQHGMILVPNLQIRVKTSTTYPSESVITASTRGIVVGLQTFVFHHRLKIQSGIRSPGMTLQWCLNFEPTGPQLPVFHKTISQGPGNECVNRVAWTCCTCSESRPSETFPLMSETVVAQGWNWALNFVYCKPTVSSLENWNTALEVSPHTITHICIRAQACALACFYTVRGSELKFANIKRTRYAGSFQSPVESINSNGTTDT